MISIGCSPNGPTGGSLAVCTNEPTNKRARSWHLLSIGGSMTSLSFFLISFTARHARRRGRSKRRRTRHGNKKETRVHSRARDNKCRVSSRDYHEWERNTSSRRGHIEEIAQAKFDFRLFFISAPFLRLSSSEPPSPFARIAKVHFRCNEKREGISFYSFFSFFSLRRLPDKRRRRGDEFLTCCRDTLWPCTSLIFLK